jgi:hypothetical protein
MAKRDFPTSGSLGPPSNLPRVREDAPKSSAEQFRLPDSITNMPPGEERQEATDYYLSDMKRGHGLTSTLGPEHLIAGVAATFWRFFTSSVAAIGSGEAVVAAETAAVAAPKVIRAGQKVLETGRKVVEGGKKVVGAIPGAVPVAKGIHSVLSGAHATITGRMVSDTISIGYKYGLWAGLGMTGGGAALKGLESALKTQIKSAVEDGLAEHFAKHPDRDPTDSGDLEHAAASILPGVVGLMKGRAATSAESPPPPEKATKKKKTKPKRKTSL